MAVDTVEANLETLSKFGTALPNTSVLLLGVAIPLSFMNRRSGIRLNVQEVVPLHRLSPVLSPRDAIFGVTLLQAAWVKVKGWR
jgi:hypothetical protein